MVEKLELFLRKLPMTFEDAYTFWGSPGAYEEVVHYIVLKYGKTIDLFECEFDYQTGKYTDKLVLSLAGREYLEAIDKRNAERADQERKNALNQQSADEWKRKDARRSWVQFAITTIITVASFFAGAIVEVFTGFMQWISAGFH
ncbi:hypothetical protein [Beduinella massiliensis]|uniref:hypothetical protein n=1 Tax=Beduinella massiliensis TaxID=1852363 RepID=UPI0031F9481D